MQAKWIDKIAQQHKLDDPGEADQGKGEEAGEDEEESTPIDIHKALGRSPTRGGETDGDPPPTGRPVKTPVIVLDAEPPPAQREQAKKVGGPRVVQK